MDTSDTKKLNLDELSKDELLKKCKGLLTIAQKAKQAKDLLQEENVKLKQELANKNKNEVSEEVIETITQQKLSLVSTIEDLKSRNSSLDSKLQIYEKELKTCQEKLNTIDNENVSYRRQITRLTDENEQLITHLDSLEKQIDELNKIGIQQRQQLLELESKAQDSKNAADENKVTELQCMLGVSLEEVKKLKNERNSLNQKIENLEINLAEKNKNILLISEELKSKCDIAEELNELKQGKEGKIGGYEELIAANELLEENVKESEVLNGKLREKLKIYHSKIVKFAGNTKALKEEKNTILQLFKQYTNQVKEWKEQLNAASRSLIQQVDTIQTENRNLKEEVETLKKDLSKSTEESSKIIDDYRTQLETLNSQKENIRRDLECELNTVGKLEGENVRLAKVLSECETERVNLNKKIEESENKISEREGVIDVLKTQINKYENEREHVQAIEKILCEKSSEEIIKLSEENKELTNINNTLQERIDEAQRKQPNVSHCDTQTDGEPIPSNELEEQLINLKRENNELLAEMNEMNQALKERGEHISKLEAHCEEIMKKLQIYESQANKNVDSITEKEEIIKNLTEEIAALKTSNNNGNIVADPELNRLRTELEHLKEKLNSNLETSYAESETMSTSTVSRTEDLSRLRDLEGSWEERYGKLRTLAIKLKGKIRELSNTLTKEQTEKDELQKKLSVNLKTIQTLQSQSDELEDELEASKRESKSYLDRLNTIAEDISKDKQSLVNQDDTISDLRKEIETLKTEKQSTDNWKKQVGAKVQTLRKELEANNLLRKEFENKITRLAAELEAKDQALRTEIEGHRQTKSQLDASNNECKKNSVLNLEMQDYERSVKDTARKLEKQQEQMTKLKGQVESQKSTVNALREQNKMLEERIREVEENIASATTEIAGYKKKTAQLEEEVQQKEDKVQSVTQLLETARSETEELSTELSKVIAEHQKTNGVLKSERDLLRSQLSGLQQNLRDAQDALKLKEDELAVVRSEYEGYKVRAQSVLRQNQNRDVGLEEKLVEEVASLKVKNSELNGELGKTAEKITMLEGDIEKVTLERDETLRKVQELETDIEEVKTQYAQLSTKYQTTINEHAETVRSLKLHAETLSQCYRQQISEQETRHNREIVEMQSRIEKSSSPVDTPPAPPTMPREEGEGSESVDSTVVPKTYPVPLERLLGSDSDQELLYMKKQLAEQECKLVHLTALLSDTEQDLAKHVQMNELLKEEIRRQQRSEEREKHAENLEYLKNVVFKFVTLHSGDERSRLVPVLNTILKLSPEETHKLNAVAKGESGIKGWTNYLPTWSTPSKPQ